MSTSGDIKRLSTNDDTGKVSTTDDTKDGIMHIHSVAEIAALIRDRRTALDLDQASLAKRVGVSRDWIIQAEKGKPTARLDLVLRTLSVLGIVLRVEAPESQQTKSSIPIMDLDQILRKFRATIPQEDSSDNDH